MGQPIPQRFKVSGRNRLWLSGAGLIVLTVVIALFAFNRATEPVYQDKRISTWIEELAYSEAGLRATMRFGPFGSSQIAMTQNGFTNVPFKTANPKTTPGKGIVALKRHGTNFVAGPRPFGIFGDASEARRAIQAMGTNATPFLARALMKRESPFSKMYWGVFNNAPVEISSLLPTPPIPAVEIRRAAASALNYIGIAAVPALPELIRALDDSDSQVHSRARATLEYLTRYDPRVNELLVGLLQPDTSNARALRLIGEFKLRGKSAIEALARASQDPDISVRRTSLGLLKQMGPEAAPAVPALARALADKEYDLRYLAAWALEEIGPAAQGAAPELEKALNDPGDRIRWAASNTLQRLRAAEKRE